MISLARAQIGKISTMADGTIRVELHLPELPPEEMTKIFQAKQKGETPVLLPSPAPKIEGKSPSQRLRNTLWHVWEQTSDQTVPFDEWYKTVIEQLIAKFKEKLE